MVFTSPLHCTLCLFPSFLVRIVWLYTCFHLCAVHLVLVCVCACVCCVGMLWPACERWAVCQRLGQRPTWVVLAHRQDGSPQVSMYMSACVSARVCVCMWAMSHRSSPWFCGSWHSPTSHSICSCAFNMLINKTE